MAFGHFRELIPNPGVFGPVYCLPCMSSSSYWGSGVQRIACRERQDGQNMEEMTERHGHTICLDKNNSWHQCEFQSGPSWYILISSGLVVVYLVNQHGPGPGAYTAWSMISDRKMIMMGWCDVAWHDVELLLTPWNELFSYNSALENASFLLYYSNLPAVSF